VFVLPCPSWVKVVHKRLFLKPPAARNNDEHLKLTTKTKTWPNVAPSEPGVLRSSLHLQWSCVRFVLTGRAAIVLAFAVVLCSFCAAGSGCEFCT
jgi:hypothetical protein